MYVTYEKMHLKWYGKANKKPRKVALSKKKVWYDGSGDTIIK